MDTSHGPNLHPNIDFELEIARDEYRRRLPEVVTSNIRWYIAADRVDMFAFRDIAEIVVGVHRDGPMTIAAAVRSLYPTLRGAPTGIQVANAIRYATH